MRYFLITHIEIDAKSAANFPYLNLLFYYAVPSSKYIFFEVGPDTIAKMELYRSIFYKVTFTVQWELVVKTVSTLTALLSRSLETVVRHKIMYVSQNVFKLPFRRDKIKPFRELPTDGIVEIHLFLINIMGFHFWVENVHMI